MQAHTGLLYLFFCLTCDYHCDLCKIPLSPELKDGCGGALVVPGGLRLTLRMMGCKIQDGICPNQNQSKIDSKRMKRQTRVKLTSKQKLKTANALVTRGAMIYHVVMKSTKLM